MKKIHPDAQKKMIEGALKASRAISTTYGPKGRIVLLSRMAGLLPTKDGVTVSREILLSDPVENLGCQILKEACITVNDETGDGTTTTAILAAEILREGHKLIQAGVSTNEILEGLQEAKEQTLQFFEGLSRPLVGEEEIQEVAKISCNGDEELSVLLAEAAMAAGEDGLIILEDSPGVSSYLEFKEGMELEITGSRLPDEIIEGPLVAVIDQELKTFKDVKSLLEVASQWPQNRLILFTKELLGEARITLNLNLHKGIVSCMPIPAPGMGPWRSEYLKDIAACSGASFVTTDTGLDPQKWDPEWFGSLRKLTLRSNKALLQSYEENEPRIDERIEALKKELEQTVSTYDQDRYRERISLLSGGLVLLKLGAATELERKEKRARTEDALSSIRAVLKNGVLPGGGISYLMASSFLSDTQEKIGARLLAKALKRPFLLLAEKCGYVGSVIAPKIEKEWEQELRWFGLDMMTGEIRDLDTKPRILDPFSVAKSVVNSAVSVASILLSTKTAVTELGEK